MNTAIIMEFLPKILEVIGGKVAEAKIELRLGNRLVKIAVSTEEVPCERPTKKS